MTNGIWARAKARARRRHGSQKKRGFHILSAPAASDARPGTENKEQRARIGGVEPADESTSM